MLIDDFWDLLSCLWMRPECSFKIEHARIKFHLFKLLAAYSASRPAAILGTVNMEGEIWHYLTYRDCRLVLLPDPSEPDRPVRCLEVTFRWTKNDRGQSCP